MQINLSEHFTYKKLFRFTLPSIVMMIFTSIYGRSHRFFFLIIPYYIIRNRTMQTLSIFLLPKSGIFCGCCFPRLRYDFRHTFEESLYPNLKYAQDCAMIIHSCFKHQHKG